MTGPEHYKAAEELLDRVRTEYLDDGAMLELIGRANAHAQLAAAAAYALSHYQMMPINDKEAWYSAAHQPV